MSRVIPNKKLGQHWLHDTQALEAMCRAARVRPGDTVLEIGPGLGPLTERLVARAKNVVAVEFDVQLAQDLPRRVGAKNLEVIPADILRFDLSRLPKGYKVAANVPYYITSKIVRLLLESANRPAHIALLVQKEVAERLAAAPGEMSVLSISAQYYAAVQLGMIVPARSFTPPPEVDSQVVCLAPHDARLFPDIETKLFFRVVKAGFVERRKKLRSSLAGGLQLEKSAVDSLLEAADIPAEARAQELSLEDWARLARTYLATIGS